MNDEMKRILEMLSQGKITVDEADRLLNALGGAPAQSLPPLDSAATGETKQRPKFLVVKVNPGRNGENGDGERVDVRIPLGLVRAGMKLGAMIPDSAMAKINAKLGSKGIDFDLADLKGQDADGLLENLKDLNINVTEGSDTVRVYCE